LKSVIFLGPSLPVEEARQILDTIYLPPAGQADLLTAIANHRPDVVGLIDGVFLQSLSVWHKEILYAIDEGIQVYGASSMGAIRAAETAAFGMIGVGEVYRRYASGELIDDDEVALSHASAEQAFRKMSEPMVNVRATLRAAHDSGVITADQLVCLLEIAKPIYFAQRTFPAILEAAGAHGLPRSVLDKLARFISTSYVDVKRQDAIELLQIIRQLPESGGSGPKATKTFAFKRSTAFETLYNRDRRVEHGGTELHLESISNYVALHDADFDETNFNALNRVVVFAFAEMLGLEASAEAVATECRRFRQRIGLEDDAALASWLQANHLDFEEFRSLMSQRVLCRRLHRWFLMAMWMERTSKVILDELRLKNRYTEWLARAAAQERLLEAAAPDGHLDASRLALQDLITEHCGWTECRIDTDSTEWAEETGFHSKGNLKMELSRASIARRAMLELLAQSSPECDDEDQPAHPSDPSGAQRFHP
jgi:hypothetical protein